MNKLFSIVSIVLIAGLITWVSCLEMRQTSTAYVQLGKLYSEFQMTKELEANYTNVSNKRKQILDSLELQVRMLSRELESSAKKDAAKISLFQVKREEYFGKKQQFEEDNQRMNQQFQEQISKQINQYIQDYGKDKKYDYIFGAEGSGAIMHANEKHDITKEVLAYVNDRYKGKK